MQELNEVLSSHKSLQSQSVPAQKLPATEEKSAVSSLQTNVKPLMPNQPATPTPMTKPAGPAAIPADARYSEEPTKPLTTAPKPSVPASVKPIVVQPIDSNRRPETKPGVNILPDKVKIAAKPLDSFKPVNSAMVPPRDASVKQSLTAPAGMSKTKLDPVVKPGSGQSVKAVQAASDELGKLRALAVADLRQAPSVYVFLEDLAKKMNELKKYRELSLEQITSSFEQSPLYHTYLEAGLKIMDKQEFDRLSHSEFEAMADFRASLRKLLSK